MSEAEEPMTDAPESQAAAPAPARTKSGCGRWIGRLFGAALLLLCYLSPLAYLLFHESMHYDSRWEIALIALCLVMGLYFVTGMWRLHRTQTLGWRQQLGIMVAVVLLSLLAGLLLSWPVAGFVFMGLATALSWALPWSEGTSAVMLDGPLGRVLWAVYAVFMQVAMFVAGFSMLMLIRAQFVGGGSLAWLLCWIGAALFLVPGMVRSMRARHRARRYLAIQDGTIHELEPE